MASYAYTNASYNMHIESYACYDEGSAMIVIFVRANYEYTNATYNMHIASYACPNAS